MKKGSGENEENGKKYKESASLTPLGNLT